MQEHHIEIPRTARYYTLGPLSRNAREAWVVCHGYRQLARRFLGFFQTIDDGSRLIVAPEALSRFYIDRALGPHGPEHRIGASWMTREDRLAEIGDYVGYLDSVADSVLQGGSPRRLVVLGFSQGAHTASRWVVQGRVRPDELILWGGGLAHDLDPDRSIPAMARLRVTMVRGEEDDSVSAEAHERELVRMKEWGIRVRTASFVGGHRLDQKLLQRLAEAR
jgi:predicted esterase